MSDAIIVALITGGITLIGIIVSHFGTISQMEKKSELSDEAIKGQINVIDEKISALSDRVERHNKVIERTYALENRMGVAEERISDANHRINELRDRPQP
jgi:predicted  nucleic acid-binding Zn-ribbon protein